MEEKEKDRWEQKGRIFLLFISFTSFSIASLSPVYPPSLPTTYHPTLVHRQTRDSAQPSYNCFLHTLGSTTSIPYPYPSYQKLNVAINCVFEANVWREQTS